MKLQDQEIFSLDNFEGSLDLLWHLIHRNEIDIYEVALTQITKQYVEKIRELSSSGIDLGAEFISQAAALVWLKSKTLLPKHEQEEVLEEEYDPQFEIIHQLLDYCRFKQAAKELAQREEQQSAFYARGVDEIVEAKKNLGINHLTLEDLATMFRQVLSRAASQKGVIHEEIWRVADKIKSIRSWLQEQKSIPFGLLFTAEKSREELIVTFLALLELMKVGEARVVGDLETRQAYIQAT